MSPMFKSFLRPLVVLCALWLVSSGCEEKAKDAPAPSKAPPQEAAGEPIMPTEDETKAKADGPLTVNSYPELVQCLKDRGVRMYGSPSCPHCTRLTASFGGNDVIGPVYTDCSQDRATCQAEMKGRGIPEIQIKGEMYQGSRDPAQLGASVGCLLAAGVQPPTPAPAAQVTPPPAPVMPAVPEAEQVKVASIPELVGCLKDKGVRMYGSPSCPHCNRLTESFGGYEVLAAVYTDCSQDRETCQSEMKGRGIPEIQIKGQMYQGSRDPAQLGAVVGCMLQK